MLVNLNLLICKLVLKTLSVSVQSWDHHDKYSSDHNYQNGDRPKMLWDGMRKSQVVKELEEKPTG